MADVIGVMDCPICGSEVNVKRNSNKKPTFYCKTCRVQITSSGGQSMQAIMSQIRPIEAASTPLLEGLPAQKEEVKENAEMVRGGKNDREGNVDSGRSAADGRGFLSWLINGQ